MITITNTFKEKLTKTFVPSIFYSLLPLALICLYFYVHTFAPFFTPITHQSSLSTSPHLTKGKLTSNVTLLVSCEFYFLCLYHRL